MSEKSLSVCGTRFVAGLAVLAAVVMMKRFYSRADSGELAWIIRPVAHLLESVADFSFVHEAGFGWVDSGYNIVIAPACAGVNFMIIAFCMSSFMMLRRKGTAGRIITTIAITGIASYVVTVIASAVRIILSVQAYRLDIYSGWLTPESVHRSVGVCVYYLFLCFHFQLVCRCYPPERQAGEGSHGAGVSMGKWFVFLVPLSWYLAFSIGVPFINGAYKTNHESFLLHALGVGSVSILLTLIISTAYYFINALRNDP